MLESFEQAWRTQDHRKKDTMQNEMTALLTELGRERRRGRLVLTLCGAYTAAATIVIAWVFSRREISPAEVWPLLLAQFTAIAVLAWIGRKRLADFRDSRARTASVQEAASRALRATNTEIRTSGVTAVAMTIMAVLLALSIAGLYSSGKMDDRAVSAMVPLVLLILAFNLLVLWRRWTQKLRPRRERLSQIAHDLGAD